MRRSSERRALRGWAWGLLAAVALLWPARLSGPLDGAPLDGVAEAVVIGVVLPALLWCHHRFLATRFARACVVAIVMAKALMAVAVTPDGWCVRFVPSAPYVKDGTGAPHSWDVRADWRSADPSCSAIVTRPYNTLSEFPAWFFNLPPPNDNWPVPSDRPPGAVVAMTVSGFLRASAPGVLQILTGPDVTAIVHVNDGASSGDATPRSATLGPGLHRILIEATLTGDRWRFVPLWNGASLWSASPATLATTTRPSALDRAIRPWGRWIIAALVTALTLAWLVSASARIRDMNVLTWTIGAASCTALFAALGYDELARWSLVGLLGAVVLPVPSRLRNIFGALVLVGVPWLTLVVVLSAPQAGRFRLYGAGNDYWSYQRYAYRIVMQGYWLEGGSATFWFQPFYRWIIGLLHLVFGDSSIGESFWESACVLVMALFAFHASRVFAGFRWGLVAAVMTLAVFTLGTTWGHVGLGLADISSVGFLYLAALVALHSRHRNWRAAIAAGVLATLTFYTRLNNLLLAFGVALFALPLSAPARIVFRPSALRSRTAWRTVGGVWATLCAGLLLFAWRTWHYTGVFSLFYGTQRDSLALWQPGMSLAAYLRAIPGSVMMVLTMNDPPRFDAHALPLLIGAAMSLLAVVQVPWLRDLPLGLVLFCLVGISGSLIARGSAYPGRFSIHLIGVACAVVVCAAALLCRTLFTRSTSSSS